ncbi:MAG: pitrilysin family protein [Planctomycetota bacterium]
MTTSAPVYCGATIHERMLENGLRVLIAERHLDPVVAAMVWYRVGGRHEREDEAGVSHFLEHMMFKGTEAYGKGIVDLETTVLGGSNNAFTTPDHTAYWFEFASDRWERALDLEADRMRGLLFDPDEFAAEKQVVLEELSMGLDDPWRSLSRRASEVLFGRHPYARPVIGYRDTLEPMTVDDMRSFYRRYYRPGNATIVIVGAVDSDAAVAAIEERFGDIEDVAPEGTERPVPAPEFDGEVRIRTSWDDGASRLIMAWPGATFGSDDDFTLDVVVAHLTSGKLSRLYRHIVVEGGLATSVSANNDARAEAGGFWLYAEAVQGVEPETLEAALDAEIRRISETPLTEAQLSRAKKLLAASEAFDSETVTDVAETIGEYAVDLSDWREVLRSNDRRSAVTAEQVQETCRRLLRPDRRVVAWSLPRVATENDA